jgi:uridine kinase
VRLLIDGRSGSGKTELATALARATGAQLVRLDALYPGWDGLAHGSAAVADLLTTGRWRAWDWQRDGPGEWHEIDLSAPIIVEGCGALTARNRALADVGLWVAFDASARKTRALARDGANYEPHWDRWAAQEDAFIALERPESIADAVIDGADVTKDLERWRSLFDPARVDE